MCRYVYRFGGTSKCAYTRTQTRGATAELRRVADTTSHDAYPQAGIPHTKSTIKQCSPRCYEPQAQSSPGSQDGITQIMNCKPPPTPTTPPLIVRSPRLLRITITSIFPRHQDTPLAPARSSSPRHRASPLLDTGYRGRNPSLLDVM